ncbi:MAG: SecY-interacting protein Syd [gamma proteobacterium symbiont of Taylorina sp.]|nr:SecY-interacting protein Syd [gamma proteobacterium symbiont of Taylorina sp.]
MNYELSKHPLHNSLDNFFKRYLNMIERQSAALPITEYHADWPSPCHCGEPFMTEEMNYCIHWKPIKREEQRGVSNDLSRLEKALEIQLYPDIKVFFSDYWCEQMEVTFLAENELGGNLTLMFVCNEDDMERLIKNQLGHALNKIRNKQSLTFFIACTDSDYIISIENNSGHVVLERPGYPIEKVLSNSLKEFIDKLDYGSLA